MKQRGGQKLSPFFVNKPRVCLYIGWWDFYQMELCYLNLVASITKHKPA
jgi:hypothetical protein